MKNNDDLKNYTLKTNLDHFFSTDQQNPTKVDTINIDGKEIKRFINEYWTSKQRQSNSIHEISYRACFKAELPRFFIKLLTNKDDVVYDPFSGRGTSVVEAGLLGRNVISNDINPLSEILAYPRFFCPDLDDIKRRLNKISFDYSERANIDLSMFYHPKTEAEIVSLKKYLISSLENNEEDYIDKWIRMVTTNRLTGHSKGFFSVYTLPPNQAVSQKRQNKLNEKRGQKPEYREIKPRIIKKSKSLMRDVTRSKKNNLREAGKKSIFLTKDARYTKDKIKSESVDLLVTSPPFLDVVQYSKDNWLRCWFNNIDIKKVEEKITTPKKLDEWKKIMGEAFKEFYRLISKGGYVAFEVGEVRKGKIKLDEHVVPLGLDAGFDIISIIINLQKFTKTANIWGVDNNSFGTNTNRIVLFKK